MQQMELAVTSASKSALILRALLPGGEPSEGELSSDEDEPSGDAKSPGKGKGKGRGKGKPKTPGSAKGSRAPSGYNLFIKEVMVRLQANEATAKLTQPERMKRAGEEWSSLSAEAKQVYLDRAAALKAGAAVEPAAATQAEDDDNQLVSPKKKKKKNKD